MCIRKGAPKAIMALAHHMMVVVYQVLSRREEYVEMGGDYYDQRDKPKTVARLVTRLAKLGYEVDLKPRNDALPADPVREELVPELNEAPATSEKDEKPTRRRGRPCKCAERGIKCQHQTSSPFNSLIPQAVRGNEFS
jgi:hypothetical protein